MSTFSLGFFLELLLYVAVKTYSLRFVLNDVSSAMGEGRVYQTVQTGTCEAKGPSAPCGGGGVFSNNTTPIQNLILHFNSSLNPGSDSYCQQEWTIHRLVALKVQTFSLEILDTWYSKNNDAGGQGTKGRTVSG